MSITFAQNILFKRFLSRIIDIAIPFIGSGIGYALADNLQKIYKINEIISMINFMFIMYFVTIIFSIFINKGKTIGDITLKIEMVKMKDNSFSLSKILIREIYFFLFFFGITISNTGIILFILHIIPIFNNKHEDYIVTALDIIFGSKYIKAIVHSA